MHGRRHHARSRAGPSVPTMDSLQLTYWLQPLTREHATGASIDWEQAVTSLGVACLSQMRHNRVSSSAGGHMQNRCDALGAAVMHWDVSVACGPRGLHAPLQTPASAPAYTLRSMPLCATCPSSQLPYPRPAPARGKAGVHGPALLLPHKTLPCLTYVLTSYSGGCASHQPAPAHRTLAWGPPTVSPCLPSSGLPTPLNTVPQHPLDVGALPPPPLRQRQLLRQLDHAVVVLPEPERVS